MKNKIRIKFTGSYTDAMKYRVLIHLRIPRKYYFSLYGDYYQHKHTDNLKSDIFPWLDRKDGKRFVSAKGMVSMLNLRYLLDILYENDYGVMLNVFMPNKKCLLITDLYGLLKDDYHTGMKNYLTINRDCLTMDEENLLRNSKTIRNIDSFYIETQDSSIKNFHFLCLTGNESSVIINNIEYPIESVLEWVFDRYGKDPIRAIRDRRIPTVKI